MKAVRTPDCNVEYKGAADTEVGLLPACRVPLKWVIEHPRKGITEVEKGGMHPVMEESGNIISVPAQAVMMVRSTWVLEEHEIEMIKNTEGECRFILVQYGDPMPPTGLTLAPIPEEEQ